MLVFLYLAILLGFITYFEYKNSKISENINKNMSLILTKIEQMYSLINCIYDLKGDIYENINDFISYEYEENNFERKDEQNNV